MQDKKLHSVTAAYLQDVSSVISISPESAENEQDIQSASSPIIANSHKRNKTVFATGKATFMTLHSPYVESRLTGW
jgi:hypothetical protein